MATLLLADDHPILLRGLRDLVEQSGAYTVVAAVATGLEALEVLIEHRPIHAILDLNMPLMSGLDVLKRSTELGLPTRTVLLAATATDAEIVAATELNATVLFKDEAPSILLTALATIANKDRKPAPFVSVALERVRAREARVHSAGLTAREIEIQGHMRAGLSNGAIANMLVLSQGTVKAHVHSIYRKLGISNRGELNTLASD